MKSKPEIEINSSTEEKIKEAARRVFTKKGYAGTRTRDIAEESGFNLALINYYFRSKEKLFDIVMVEHLQTFIHSVMGIVNDSKTTLQQKMEILISHYIDLLIKNPDIPIFVLGEINANPAKLIATLGFNKVTHENLYVVKQWKELAATKKMPDFNPIHIMINILSLTIFPFIASPLLRNRTGMSMDEFNQLMEERKKLIPVWVKAVMASGGIPI
jgi:AcrR family transcriptional regulator